MIRGCMAEDLEPLARLWHEAWHDARGGRAPAALAAERGPAHFAAKLPELAPRLFLCGGPGAPEGFAEIRQNEVHRLFVARAARGAGVATALLAEAETRIHAAKFATGKLACLVTTPGRGASASGGDGAIRVRLRAGSPPPRAR